MSDNNYTPGHKRKRPRPDSAQRMSSGQNRRADSGRRQEDVYRRSSMLTTDGAEQDMLQTTLKAEGRTDSRAVRTMSMKAGIQAAPAGGQRQRVMTMVIIEECRRMMIIREILRKGKSVIQ